MRTAVRAIDLRVRRAGREVLPGLTFDIPTGSLVGLLGPSGAGKTTLMRAIVGAQRNVTGTLEVLGLRAGHKMLRHRIGYLTQQPSVYFDLTVRQNLRYFAAVLAAPASDVERVIDEVDLRVEADNMVSKLSGGQISRVSLASALLGKPELLVLDEPTVGLDPVLRRDLWKLFRALADSGVTLLVSSHVMDEAARCEKLLLLREGRLLASDSLSGVLAATAAPDVEGAFLQLVEGSAR